jgi:phospholipid N-methyltransferase
MATKFKIDDDVRDVLSRSTMTESSVILPPEKLDRKFYLKIHDVLAAAGGKWNRKQGAHLFSSDPRELLGMAIEHGIARNVQQESQLFPTPPMIARQVVRLAKIEPAHLILEPSAGTGRLLEAIPHDITRREVMDVGSQVTAIEIDESMCNELRSKFPEMIGICADFLSVDGYREVFDRIIMNPPFTKGADIIHIRHALKMLASGGRLVSICADGPRQQEALKPIASEWIELPTGSFKTSGTNSKTAIFVYDKE